MKIPFSSFRFSKAENMTWGMNIFRYIQRNNEYISWVGYPRGIGGISSKFGHLIGLEKLTVERKLQFKPYLTFGQNSYQNSIIRTKDINGKIDNFNKNSQLKKRRAKKILFAIKFFRKKDFVSKVLFTKLLKTYHRFYLDDGRNATAVAR